MDMAEVKRAKEAEEREDDCLDHTSGGSSYSLLRPNRFQSLVVLLCGSGVSIDPIAPLAAVAPLGKSVGDVERSSPSPNRSAMFFRASGRLANTGYCC
jgi:hypothetical protein